MGVHQNEAARERKGRVPRKSKKTSGEVMSENPPALGAYPTDVIIDCDQKGKARSTKSFFQNVDLMK